MPPLPRGSQDDSFRLTQEGVDEDISFAEPLPTPITRRRFTTTPRMPRSARDVQNAFRHDDSSLQQTPLDRLNHRFGHDFGSNEVSQELVPAPSRDLLKSEASPSGITPHASPLTSRRQGSHTGRDPPRQTRVTQHSSIPLTDQERLDDSMLPNDRERALISYRVSEGYVWRTVAVKCNLQSGEPHAAMTANRALHIFNNATSKFYAWKCHNFWQPLMQEADQPEVVVQTALSEAGVISKNGRLAEELIRWSNLRHGQDPKTVVQQDVDAALPRNRNRLTDDDGEEDDDEEDDGTATSGGDRSFSFAQPQAGSYSSHEARRIEGAAGRGSMAQRSAQNGGSSLATYDGGFVGTGGGDEADGMSMRDGSPANAFSSPAAGVGHEEPSSDYLESGIVYGHYSDYGDSYAQGGGRGLSQGFIEDEEVEPQEREPAEDRYAAGTEADAGAADDEELDGKKLGGEELDNELADAGVDPFEDHRDQYSHHDWDGGVQQKNRQDDVDEDHDDEDEDYDEDDDPPHPQPTRKTSMHAALAPASQAADQDHSSASLFTRAPYGSLTPQEARDRRLARQRIRNGLRKSISRAPTEDERIRLNHLRRKDYDASLHETAQIEQGDFRFLSAERNVYKTPKVAKASHARRPIDVSDLPLAASAFAPKAGQNVTSAPTDTQAITVGGWVVLDGKQNLGPLKVQSRSGAAYALEMPKGSRFPGLMTFHNKFLRPCSPPPEHADDDALEPVDDDHGDGSEAAASRELLQDTDIQLDDGEDAASRELLEEFDMPIHDGDDSIEPVDIATVSAYLERKLEKTIREAQKETWVEAYEIGKLRSRGCEWSEICRRYRLMFPGREKTERSVSPPCDHRLGLR